MVGSLYMGKDDILFLGDGVPEYTVPHLSYAIIYAVDGK